MKQIGLFFSLVLFISNASAALYEASCFASNDLKNGKKEIEIRAVLSVPYDPTVIESYEEVETVYDYSVSYNYPVTEEIFNYDDVVKDWGRKLTKYSSYKHLEVNKVSGEEVYMISSSSNGYIEKPTIFNGHKKMITVYSGLECTVEEL